MPESRMRRIGGALRRRWAIAVTAGVAVVLVGAGATTALAATAPVTAATSSSATCAPRIGQLLRGLPDSLKADLKTLRHDAKAAKPAERAAIKAKALAGGYGAELEQLSRIVAGTTGKPATVIPAALKADLKTLHGDAKGSAARTAEVQSIFTKAVAGSYGTTFESIAKRVTANSATRCAAKSGATQG